MKAISIAVGTDESAGESLYVLCDDGSLFSGSWGRGQLTWERVTDVPWSCGERADTPDVQTKGRLAK